MWRIKGHKVNFNDFMPFLENDLLSANLRNMGFRVIQLVKNSPAMQETPVQFLGREDPLEKV